MSQAIEAIRNSFKIPELKQRIIFTLIILAIYRLGSHIPTPGIDGAALAERIAQGGMLLGFYDLFTGGALQRASVLALGIMPYITVSIIISLLVAVIPSLEKLAKEGPEGQKKITEYTRYGTVALGIVQSIGMATLILSMNTRSAQIVPNPGLGYYLTCIITFTAGAVFIMWLGEQISEHGVGNGISLLIFVSIVARMPAAVLRVLSLLQDGEINLVTAFILGALMVVIIAGVILVTTGQRRIPIQYPRQVKGRRVYQGSRNYLPLRVNQAGVIPIIFASSILMLPGSLSHMVTVPWLRDFLDRWFNYQSWPYMITEGILIVFFTYFYTAVTFNPVEIADNLKKHGGVVMGVRPGRATAEYLNRVMTRITLVGALFLAVVAMLPSLVNVYLDIYDPLVSQFFGGTSLLILVGVALDTVRQIEQHLIMRNYEGFMKGGRRMRGRRY